MDDISDELKTFATMLFDVDGKLRQKFINHEYHRGTGAWGRELDNGMLVYIEAIRVEKMVRCYSPVFLVVEINTEIIVQFRRMGLASLALQSLLTSSHVHTTDFLVTLPGFLYQDADTRKERSTQLAITTDFFRKVCP